MTPLEVEPQLVAFAQEVDGVPVLLKVWPGTVKDLGQAPPPQSAPLRHPPMSPANSPKIIYDFLWALLPIKCPLVLQASTELRIIAMVDEVLEPFLSLAVGSLLREILRDFMLAFFSQRLAVFIPLLVQLLQTSLVLCQESFDWTFMKPV